MTPTLFYAICGALLGAALGSYLGSVAWRIPNRHSLAGRSLCPGCGQAVPAYLNVPVLSYLALRGRAACCGSPLSLWYPLFEVTTLLAGAAVGYLFGLAGLGALALGVIGGSLLVKAVVDRR